MSISISGNNMTGTARVRCLACGHVEDTKITGNLIVSACPKCGSQSVSIEAIQVKGGGG